MLWLGPNREWCSQELDDCMAAARILKAAGEFETLKHLYQHLQTLQPKVRGWRVAEACIAAELGDEEALRRKLVAGDLEPLEIAELKLIAWACTDGQRHDLAVEFYSSAHQINCEDAEVVLQLAAALAQVGDREQAANVLQNFLAGEVEDLLVAAQAWFNLGVVSENSSPDLAIQAYQKALVLVPEYDPPVANLAILLTRQGKFVETIEFLEPHVAAQVDWPRTAVLMASANRLNHRLDDAIKVLKSVVDSSGKHSESEVAREMLIRCLIESGDSNAAISRCQAWLEAEPHNAIAAHMLAAIQGSEAPERASAEYVAKTFDSFADSFDSVLKNLEYRAPQLVGHLVGETLGTPAGDQVILSLIHI